jgi:hypothetical protein
VKAEIAVEDKDGKLAESVTEKSEEKDPKATATAETV